MITRRVHYIDLAKFLAILLVCVGHSCKMVENESSNSLYEFIYSFHMPLFMMLSGMFAEKSLSIDILSFIKKKTTQLLVPAFSTIAIVCVFYYLFSKHPSFGFFLSEIIGGMWFLKCLFACYLYCYLFHKITKKFWLMAFLSAVCIFIVPKGDFLRINYFYICFLVGLILKRNYEIVHKHINVITIVAIAYFCCFGNIGEPPKFVQFDIKLLLKLPMYLATGISGSVAVLGMSYYLEQLFNGVVIRQCCKIGTYTLGMYCIQTVLLERGLNKLLYPLGCNETWTIFVCISIGGIICILSYWVSLLFDKSKLTCFIFLGK